MITAYGWEVHFTGASSDKYYRMIFLQTGFERWTALANYGRRTDAGCGQFKAYNATSENAALHMARNKTNEKEAKHYVPTRDLTAFEVDQDVAFTLCDGPNVRKRQAMEIVQAFFLAADLAGTTKPGAAR